jgi:hypothetical protein
MSYSKKQVESIVRKAVTVALTQVRAPKAAPRKAAPRKAAPRKAAAPPQVVMYNDQPYTVNGEGQLVPLTPVAPAKGKGAAKGKAKGKGSYPLFKAWGGPPAPCPLCAAEGHLSAYQGATPHGSREGVLKHTFQACPHSVNR